MDKSSISIIKHIPLFLAYYKKEGYSHHTQENYKRYLDRFVSWLKKTNKQDMKPHKLSTEDIWAYRLYLSRSQNEKGQVLKKVSQAYYLIALRALLGYFMADDVVSLLPAQISLPRGYKEQKALKHLALDQIDRLLQAPNTKTDRGLRNRAILETLISAGFKIQKLTQLNRGQLDDIPGRAIIWIDKYLKTRKDKNKALFINYKAEKDSIGGRLTARSIERMVNNHGRKIGLPFFVTPEILRWARAYALLNEEIKIKKIYTHNNFAIKNYKQNNNSHKENIGELAPTWNNVESSINKEILWLKNSIPILSGSYKANPSLLRCDDCILRKIAILIVGGKVRATEFRAEKNKDLWNSLTEKQNLQEISHHGQEWHKKIMDIIYEYFKTQGGEVTLEPVLNYGRADLGISLKPNKNIYVEVDTVSLFKLWYNLSTMGKATFLIIPSEDRIIEFNV